MIEPPASPVSNHRRSRFRITRFSRPSTSRQTARRFAGIMGTLPFFLPPVFAKPFGRPRFFGSLASLVAISKDRLIRWKLMRRDRTGGWECAMNLFRALAELPFTRIRRDGSRTFSMREFLARIEELIEAEHAELDRRRGR